MREFYSYVWRSSAPRQIVLRILAISAALLAMAPLELQRHIINTVPKRPIPKASGRRPRSRPPPTGALDDEHD
jgi:hypothetical protein